MPSRRIGILLLRAWRRQRLSVVGALIVGALGLVALLGPSLAPHDPSALGPDVLAGPSFSHFMGTDQFGRDVFSRWLGAARPSLIVALSSVGGAAILGTFMGLLAGYKNGSLIDVVAMRTVDAIISVPLIVAVIAIAGTIGSRTLELGPLRVSPLVVLILVLTVTFIPAFARIARAGALAEMQEDYVSAAKVLGADNRRLLFEHLLPNVLPPLLIQGSFSIALAIGVEATVSFLGFGIQPPDASWGNLLTGSRDYILAGKWWLLAFPAAVIVLAVFAFNLLGDGLRDWLDPRQRARQLL